MVHQAACSLPVSGGTFGLHVFGAEPDGPEELLVALHRPDPSKDAIPVVRLHSACATGDVLGSMRCDCGPQLAAAMESLLRQEYGILVYLLQHEGRGIGLANKIRAYALQDQGLDTVEANVALGLPVDARDYRHAAAALRWFGVSRLRLVTNNPLKLQAMVDAGIEVVERVPHAGFVTPFNLSYLQTKDRVLGHLHSVGLPGKSTSPLANGSSAA
jgi:GTP cyclohydrolase II